MSFDLRQEVRDSIANERAVLVVGAGASVATTSNAPAASWVGLIEDGADYAVALDQRRAGKWRQGVSDDLELGVDGMGDLLISAAQKVTSALGGLGSPDFRDWLQQSVGSLQVEKSELLLAVSNLPCAVMTTNYDHLIEQVSGRRPLTWRNASQHPEVLRSSGGAVVHLHGSFEDPESVVFGHDGYSNVLKDEAAQLLQKTVGTFNSLIFVGCGDGLADPNFSSLRSWLNRTEPLAAHRHYVLCRDSDRDGLTDQFRGERLVAVPFGPDYNDLPPYLAALAPRLPAVVSSGTGRTDAARPDPWVVNLPAAPREDLVGRGHIADVIANRLDTKSHLLPRTPWVITGMSGVGKSALARKICALAVAKGLNVAWCRGASQAELLADLSLLVGEVQMRDQVAPGRHGAPATGANANDGNRSARSLLDQLAAAAWLVVIDDVSSPEILSSVDGAMVQVVATSAAAGWVGRYETFPLQSLSRGDGVTLLERELGGPFDAPDLSVAGDLVDTMGGLPLALIQAASFMRITGTTIRGYVQLLASNGLSVIDEGRDLSSGKSLANSLDVNLSECSQRSPGARELLSVLALGAGTNIPLAHLIESEGLAEKLTPFTSLALARCVADLAELSLVETSPGAVKVHGLVAFRVRELMTDQGRENACLAALSFFGRSMPPSIEHLAEWRLATTLVPHVRAALNFAEAGGYSRNFAIDSARAALIGFYAEKQPLDGLAEAQAALKGRRDIGHDDVLLLRSRSRVYRRLAKYPQAIADATSVLQFETLEHGESSNQVRTALMNLSQLLPYVNRHEEAVRLARRALRIAKSELAAESEEYAETIHFVGAALERARRLPEAQKFLQQALDLSRMGGVENRAVAHHLNHLAVVVEASGKPRNALQLREEALAIRMNVHGLGHRDTFNNLLALSRLKVSIKDIDGAFLDRKRANEAYALTYGTEGVGYLRELVDTIKSFPRDASGLISDIVASASNLTFNDGDRFLGRLPDYLARVGNEDLAIAVVSRVLNDARASVPDKADAWCARATVLEIAGRRMDAADSAAESLQLWRGSGDLYTFEARQERRHLDRLQGRR